MLSNGSSKVDFTVQFSEIFDPNFEDDFVA